MDFERLLNIVNIKEMVLIQEANFTPERLINFLKIWENNALAFLGTLYLFQKEIEALLKHDRVITFVSNNWGVIFDISGDSRPS